MNRNREIDENTCKILYQEIRQHLLNDEKPSEYFELLSKDDIMQKYPLNLLYKLKDVEQSKKHHPEGNVWNHTMLVINEAAKVREQSKDVEVFMWAALLHDIGKPDTTKIRKGRITSYDHDRVGAKLSENFLQSFSDDEDFICEVKAMVRYHMHMLYVLKELPFSDLKNLYKEVNIHEIALLCKCDRLGRTGADRQDEEKNYKLFVKALENLNARHKIG